MRTSILTRFANSCIVFSRYPFLWLFFFVFRKKIKLKFFRPDTVFAVEHVPVRLSWYIRNACSVWISGIGYVTSRRAYRIIRASRSRENSIRVKGSASVLPDVDAFTLVAKGVGGTVTASVRIRVVAVKPARLKAEVANRRSSINISAILNVSLRSPDSSGLVRPMTGILNAADHEKNGSLVTLEQLRSASTKEELKKIS
jgi:hypothetical protein